MSLPHQRPVANGIAVRLERPFCIAEVPTPQVAVVVPGDSVVRIGLQGELVFPRGLGVTAQVLQGDREIRTRRAGFPVGEGAPERLRGLTVAALLHQDHPGVPLLPREGMNQTKQ